jgi:peptidoglycan/xylan/chitin deacetylase (PgdA/CDA1 family)
MHVAHAEEHWNLDQTFVSARNAPPKAFVTISIDDGHPTDLKTAELLEKYGIRGTFYVLANNPEREVIAADGLRELATTFELGGHTLNHALLRSLSQQQAWSEIIGCKNWLEDIAGRPIVAFSHPKGKVDQRTAALVQKAGFLGARTCLFNLHEFPANPFFWGVTTQAYSHSRLVQTRHALLEKNFAGAWNYWTTFKGETLWSHHFLRAVDYVVKHGGIAHLYMHSWEIEEFGQWDVLESVLQAVARQPKSLARVTNGMLFKLWPQCRNVKGNTFKRNGNGNGNVVWGETRQ